MSGMGIKKGIMDLPGVQNKYYPYILSDFVRFNPEIMRNKY
jgi:hypothetical protein